jgi:hypothetical protein
MQNNFDIVNSFKFNHPCATLLAGPSQSGKTTLIKKIIIENNLIEPCPSRIIYCYAIWQTAYDELIESCSSFNKKIDFFKGLPEIEKFNKEENNLLILDDLILECGNDKTILNIFTRDSHHLNISVFILSQNIFPQEKYARMISLNCQYIILTNSPRDRKQVEVLAQQIRPKDANCILEAYLDAVNSKNFGYLLLDLHQLSKDCNRIQTGIFSNEERIIYRARE